jgi:phosphoglycolate phosphatase
MRRLVLFDIDGTLLTTRGRAVDAMVAAYRAVYGREVGHLWHHMDGKTELQITHELLAAVGMTRAEVDAGLAKFWPRYAEELDRALTPETTLVHPGVAELVRAVAADSECVLGLLTGNCEAGAWKKLACAQLDGFSVGAFGAHDERRDALPALAVADAERVTGKRFAGKDIVILGDTPSDITCGRSLGVTAIAVATGRYPVEELAKHRPDAVFANFADVSAVMRAIRGE